MFRRILPLALLLAGVCALPAHAAACCLSSSAFGIGRLALWEDFAVILGASTSPVAGDWNAQGAWTPNPDGYAENEWRAQLSALANLHPRLQVSGRAPVVLTQRAYGDQREAGGGLGDAQLALRYEPVFQGEYAPFPEVALNAGVTIPLGRTTQASNLGTEVTGRGSWVLTASATMEIAKAIWFVQAGGGITLPLPMAKADGLGQQFGMGYQATVAGGAEVVKKVVLSLVARYAYEGIRREQTALSMNGAYLDVPQSQAWDFGVGLNAAYLLNPHWTLQGGVDVGGYITGLGGNRQGRTTGSLAVRYAYF
ncbi:MAG: hypothetical protein ACYC8T_08630 [Myxococcaceae bacterium]